MSLELINGPAGRIGRYFSVLSVVSSAALVLLVSLLVASNAWSGDPDWSEGAKRALDGSVPRLTAFVVATLLVGLMLHPLQYALIQCCEGYWGASRPSRVLMTQGIRHHRSRKDRLVDLSDEALEALESSHGPPESRTSALPFASLPHLVAHEEAARALTEYPEENNDVRPTRLGNVLRRYEALAGRPYGLSLVTVAPHLALTSKPPHIAYLNDQRTALDLTIRMVTVSLLATGIMCGFLWRAGFWLLLALIPYAAARVFYRGSLVVAAEYGTALTVVLELNRFELYDSLRLPQPLDGKQERDLNGRLMPLLARHTVPADADEHLRFAAPPPSSSGSAAPGTS